MTTQVAAAGIHPCLQHLQLTLPWSVVDLIQQLEMQKGDNVISVEGSGEQGLSIQLELRKLTKDDCQKLQVTLKTEDSAGCLLEAASDRMKSAISDFMGNAFLYPAVDDELVDVKPVSSPAESYDASTMEGLPEMVQNASVDDIVDGRWAEGSEVQKFTVVTKEEGSLEVSDTMVAMETAGQDGTVVISEGGYPMESYLPMETVSAESLPEDVLQLLRGHLPGASIKQEPLIIEASEIPTVVSDLSPRKSVGDQYILKVEYADEICEDVEDAVEYNGEEVDVDSNEPPLDGLPITPATVTVQAEEITQRRRRRKVEKDPQNHPVITLQRPLRTVQDLDQLRVDVLFYFCNHCDKKFSKISVLKNHLRRKHADLVGGVEELAVKTDVHKAYCCHLCSQISQFKYDLGRHLHRAHHLTLEESRLATHPCLLCHKKMVSYRHLRRHLKWMHKNHPKFVDALANAQTINFQSQQHLIKKQGQKVQCPKCENVYLAIHMYRHINTAHGGDPDVAHLKAAVRTAIRAGKTHMNQKRVACPRCGKMMKHANVTKHLKKDICGENANLAPRSMTPKARQKKAAEPKEPPQPRLCEFCDRTVATKNYATHCRRTHGVSLDGTPVPKVQCFHCYRAFNDKEHLKAHMRSHSDAREWKCSLCMKGFKDKWQVYEHQRGVHLKQYRHKCNVCGKGVRKLIKLPSHVCYRESTKVDETTYVYNGIKLEFDNEEVLQALVKYKEKYNARMEKRALVASREPSEDGSEKGEKQSVVKEEVEHNYGSRKTSTLAYKLSMQREKMSIDCERSVELLGIVQKVPPLALPTNVEEAEALFKEQSFVRRALPAVKSKPPVGQCSSNVIIVEPKPRKQAGPKMTVREMLRAKAAGQMGKDDKTAGDSTKKSSENTETAELSPKEMVPSPATSSTEPSSQYEVDGDGTTMVTASPKQLTPEKYTAKRDCVEAELSTPSTDLSQSKKKRKGTDIASKPPAFLLALGLSPGSSAGRNDTPEKSIAVGSDHKGGSDKDSPAIRRSNRVALLKSSPTSNSNPTEVNTTDSGSKPRTRASDVSIKLTTQDNERKKKSAEKDLPATTTVVRRPARAIIMGGRDASRTTSGNEVVKSRTQAADEVIQTATEQDPCKATITPVRKRGRPPGSTKKSTAPVSRAISSVADKSSVSDVGNLPTALEENLSGSDIDDPEWTIGDGKDMKKGLKKRISRHVPTTSPRKDAPQSASQKSVSSKHTEVGDTIVQEQSQENKDKKACKQRPTGPRKMRLSEKLDAIKAKMINEGFEDMVSKITEKDTEVKT